MGGNGGIAGTIRHSVVAASTYGIAAAGQIYFTIEESSIIDNLGVGVLVESPAATVTIGATTIGGNGTGVQATGGSVISFGNNQMSTNGTNGNFNSPTALQ